MGRAIVKVTRELLQEVLMLPRSARIVDSQFDSDVHTIDLVVDDPVFPSVPDKPIPVVTPDTRSGISRSPSSWNGDHYRSDEWIDVQPSKP